MSDEHQDSQGEEDQQLDSIIMEDDIDPDYEPSEGGKPSSQFPNLNIIFRN